MPVVSMKQLLEAGVHFGHRARRWNPKMRSFIFTERNGIHIIDLQQTISRLEEACEFARDVAAEGGTILFVGTKKQAQETIAQEAQRCGMPFVNQRWLGGTMTNFRTIRQRIDYLINLEASKTRGELERLPKKEALQKERELARLQQRLGGIKTMRRLPEAVFVADVRRESIAVSEANSLNVPLIAMVDTNCDPDPIQYVIPANDDAIRAIRLITSKIADAVIEGEQMRGVIMAEAEEAAPPAMPVPAESPELASAEPVLAGPAPTADAEEDPEAYGPPDIEEEDEEDEEEAD